MPRLPVVLVLSPEKLNLRSLMASATRRVVDEADRLVDHGAVTIASLSDGFAQLTVDDRGRRQTVKVTATANAATALCSCQPYWGWESCRHRIAALQVLEEELRAHPRSPWRAVLRQASSHDQGDGRAANFSRIVFSLQPGGRGFEVIPYTLRRTVLPPDLPDDPGALAAAVAERKLSVEAKRLSSRVDSRYRYVDQATAEIANQAVWMNRIGNYYHSTSAGPVPSSAELFPRLAGQLVYVGTEGNPLQDRVFIRDKRATILLSLEEQGSGYALRTALRSGSSADPIDLSSAQTLSIDPLWVRIGDEVMAVDDPGGGATLLSYPNLSIPANEAEEFVSEFLTPLSERVAISGKVLEWEEIEADPVPRAYLSDVDGSLLVNLKFGYGEAEVRPAKSPPLLSTVRLSGRRFARVHRQAEREDEIVRGMARYRLRRGTELGKFALQSNVSPIDFLLDQAPKLIAAGFEIYGEEELVSARVNRHTPTISFRVSSGIDWFDLEAVVRFGEVVVPLTEIKRALRRRSRTVKLADGSIGAIPQEWIARYRHLFALAGDADGGLRVAARHLSLIDQLVLEADVIQIDPAAEQRRRELRGAKIEEVPPPGGFVGELRPYQKAGYDWLHFLRRNRFGGCLADDMGIGKTVQALAFLQSLHEAGAQPPHLIIVPRSLLENWRREAGRFTPELRVLIHHETKRSKQLEAFDGYDLVLTTYGTLLKDIALLRGRSFGYVILDEAQTIKNPASASAKAVRLLRAEHRLALTGTPIENSTIELWSLFSFLNPGLLGSLDYFRTEFAGPIERRQDEGAARLLRAIVHPFILRRTKDQVALELPPRTERLVYASLDPSQESAYRQMRDRYRAELLGLIDDGGMPNARMRVLEGLLRLRQIANHPRLVDPDLPSGSGKLELLLDTLATLRSEGHRALVFSQFVQMLTLVRGELDQLGISYCYLDGSTKDRQGEVDRFQTDGTVPFFLISLKAGGLGLNLTAADYVVHIDPWWNPAVEMQATDRTHRIGQTKPVIVTKLISSETVEEKMLLLQARKRALVEHLITTDGGGMKSLTRDDVELLFS
ncbi:MAG: SNF2-related protein [Dehalococcoidia bacterium]